VEGVGSDGDKAGTMVQGVAVSPEGADQRVGNIEKAR
jgi:hypothetical protein